MKYLTYSFVLSFCIYGSAAHAMNTEREDAVVYNAQKHTVVVYNPARQKIRKLRQKTSDNGLSFYENTHVSQNIFIRPTFPEDWTALCSIFCEGGSMTYLGSGRIQTPEQVQGMIDRNSRMNLEKNGKYYLWTILDHTGVVGRSFVDFHPEDALYPEVAYAIVPSAKGRGYATSTSLLLMKILPGSLSATVHPNNKASIAVLKKCGFKRNESKRNLPKYGSVRDYYELVRPGEVD